jgi:PhnB protein
MLYLTPYLMFDGNCEEAMNFYKEALGGEFGYMGRFGEMPGGNIPEEYKNRIMHVDLKLPHGHVFASDYMPGAPYTHTPGQSSISLSLGFEDVQSLDAAFNKMAAGGTITMALQDTFWGDRFGTLVDKYGFSWMFNCPLKKQE